MTFNMKNVRKIIKEEIDDFDWIRQPYPTDFSKLDTTKDYMNVWPQFKKMFTELGIPYIDGKVESDDYDGSCKMILKNDSFEFEIYTNFVYDQGTIETGMVYWSIQNLKKHGYVKSEHSLVNHDWLKPIVDKLREMTIDSIHKHHKLNESDDFDWIRDLEVSTPLSELEINKPYRYQIQPQLLDNTKYCGLDINNFSFMLKNEGYVKILDTSYVKEDFIFCNGGNEQILAYFTIFSNGDETNKKDTYLWILDGSILVYKD